MGLLEDAVAAIDRGEFSSAVGLLTELIEQDPSNGRAFHLRGWAKAHMGDLHGESADWSRAIELDPQFAEAYADRAAARSARGDVPGALEDWQKAVALNPEKRGVLDPLVQRFKQHGEDRRTFLRNVTGVAVATVAISLAGCRETSGGKLRWGMVIDLRRCVGCKACTIACKAENHTPPGVAYNVVMEEEVGEFPFVTRKFLPRPCMQCSNSSCTFVCPTGATYHRPDGIVVVDYDTCIGCRYCIAACPYGARSFDFGFNYSADLNPHERQPSPEYGQNRDRAAGGSPIGNVRKCMFCLHRVVNGLNPACAETCIGHAIHFGDLNDPEATCRLHGEKLRELLSTRSHMRLKEELGNDPAVYYLT